MGWSCSAAASCSTWCMWLQGLGLMASGAGACGQVLVQGLAMQSYVVGCSELLPGAGGLCRWPVQVACAGAAAGLAQGLVQAWTLLCAALSRLIAPRQLPDAAACGRQRWPLVRLCTHLHPPAAAPLQEVAAGLSLQDMVARGVRASEQEVLGVARQLLEVLQYLGNLRPAVTHRDVKPENIVVEGGRWGGEGCGAVHV